MGPARLVDRLLSVDPVAREDQSAADRVPHPEGHLLGWNPLYDRGLQVAVGDRVAAQEKGPERRFVAQVIAARLPCLGQLEDLTAQ